MFQHLLYETANRVARITLNRPAKRNALNDELVNELIHAFENAAADGDVKVIQLRAAGDVFSAGADLEYLQRLQKNSYDDNLQDSTRLAQLFKLVYSLPKPVIACVQGSAIAGGCGLATVCDFSIAARQARFGYTEARIGFVPAIVMVFLLRKIGEAHARDLMFTGKQIDADEAARIGLITQAVEPSEFENTVEQLTATLCNETSAQSLALTKTMFSQVAFMPLDAALQFAAETNAQARGSDDCKRGIAAFLNKQKINW